MCMQEDVSVKVSGCGGHTCLGEKGGGETQRLTMGLCMQARMPAYACHLPRVMHQENKEKGEELMPCRLYADWFIMPPHLVTRSGSPERA